MPCGKRLSFVAGKRFLIDRRLSRALDKIRRKGINNEWEIGLRGLSEMTRTTKPKALYFLLFLLLMTVWFPSARAANVLIQPSTQDTSIWENLVPPPDLGSDPDMDVGRLDPNFYAYPVHRALVAFDLSSIPLGSTINSANLSLFRYGYLGNPVGRTHWVYRITQSWTENGATWIDRDGGSWVTPGGDYTTAGGASSPLTALTISWNVTDIVKAWIENGEDNYGFLIKDGDETTLGNWTWLYCTRENIINESRPMLEIDYTPPLSIPVGGTILGPDYLLVLLGFLAPWIMAVAASAAVAAVVVKKRRARR
jgi:hypothetical protein